MIRLRTAGESAEPAAVVGPCGLGRGPLPCGAGAGRGGSADLGDVRLGNPGESLKLHIHPHPAIILVLCGLPLFGYTAWKFYTGGAVRELTLEVDADNQVTVKARRLWVTQVRPAFGIEKLRLFETMKGFAREAHRDQDNLPDLPVRIALVTAPAPTPCGSFSFS